MIFRPTKAKEKCMNFYFVIVMLWLCDLQLCICAYYGYALNNTRRTLTCSLKPQKNMLVIFFASNVEQDRSRELPSTVKCYLSISFRLKEQKVFLMTFQSKSLINWPGPARTNPILPDPNWPNPNRLDPTRPDTITRSTYDAQTL